MRFCYPVILTKQEDDTYAGSFPDLTGCVCRGETLQEALDDAQEAARTWVEVEMQEEVPDMPGATDLRDLTLAENQVARNILVIHKLTEGWEE